MVVFPKNAPSRMSVPDTIGSEPADVGACGMFFARCLVLEISQSFILPWAMARVERLSSWNAFAERPPILIPCPREDSFFAPDSG